MKKKYFFLLITTKLLSFATMAQWQPTGGPDGGIVVTFTSNGAYLFAGATGGGIFRSADNGASWTQEVSGLTDMNVNALAAIGTTVFSGTASAGVFVSTDNGANWTSVNTGMSGMEIKAMGVSGSYVFTSTNQGLYMSANNGANWTAIEAGLPTGIPVSAIFETGQTIYAGTAGSGVWKRTMGDITWITEQAADEIYTARDIFYSDRTV
ncbi:MAG: hypothetical protein HY738_22185 [Bacteroidia bacterium]|nr:hypothetical protein [Bacteroidia bacterium]